MPAFKMKEALQRERPGKPLALILFPKKDDFPGRAGRQSCPQK